MPPMYSQLTLKAIILGSYILFFGICGAFFGILTPQRNIELRKNNYYLLGRAFITKATDQRH
jgi:hypothetical protein